MKITRTGQTRRGDRPHVIYLAIGFPPAAKSSTYRMRETANQFCALGWDVTVVTICEEAWEREFGLDRSLSDGVDPRIRVVELPLLRQDLETDVRVFSESRSFSPPAWNKKFRARSEKRFPEPTFGMWRSAFEKAVLRIHREHHADLLLTSCPPYVTLAAAWRLWQDQQVPYVVDYRDGWSVNVLSDGETFSRTSVAGEWEARVLGQARMFWSVNDPIAGFFRDRYPEIADRIHVVRNGFDADSLPASIHHPDPANGLTFGYVGSVNFSPAFLESVLTAWRIARRDDPVIARSTFELRGHIGAGANREANAHMNLLKAAEADGVRFGGPVAKADLASVYAGWDALVLMLVGGKYVTSGKVYEYLATGLPVLSAHEVTHAANTVLDGHPLWTGAVGIEPHRLAPLFSEAARLALTATDADRAAVRAMAQRFGRSEQLRSAVTRATSLIQPALGAAMEESAMKESQS